MFDNEIAFREEVRSQYCELVNVDYVESLDGDAFKAKAHNAQIHERISRAAISFATRSEMSERYRGLT